MSKRKRQSRWPLFLIGSSAAVAVWGGWVGLGELSGFGVVHLLPGIWDSFHLNTAITLPIGVEAYGATALGAWINPATPKAARKFAKRSAIGALALGMLGQVAYHLLSAYHYRAAPWWIVTVVACLPVITLGFAAALHHLRNVEDEEEPVQTSPVLPEPPKVETFTPVAPPMPHLERTLPTPAAPWPVPAPAPVPVQPEPMPVFHGPSPRPEQPWEEDPAWLQAPPAEMAAPAGHLGRKVIANDAVRATASFPMVRG